MYGVIYTITNRINGKIYVGQTTAKNPSLRWSHHRKPSAGRRSSRPLYYAIKKYGKDAFDFVVVQTCSDSSELDRYERLWIRKCRALVPHGYNLMNGGNKAGRHSNETRLKLKSAWQRPGAKERRGAATSKALTGNPNLIDAVTKSYLNPEVREKHRQGAIRSNARPDVKSRKREAMIKAHQNPEVKERHRVGLLAAFKRPEVMERVAKAAKDIERNLKISVALKKVYSNPEKLALHSIRAKEVAQRPEIIKWRREIFLDPVYKKMHQENTQIAMNRPEVRNKISVSSKVFYNSEQGKLTQSRRNKGRRWITNGEINKRPNLTKPLPEGWYFGRVV